MELLDGGGRRLRRGHLDESVAARVAGPDVRRQGGGFDDADLGEQLAKTVVGHRARDTTHLEPGYPTSFHTRHAERPLRVPLRTPRARAIRRRWITARASTS